MLYIINQTGEGMVPITGRVSVIQEDYGYTIVHRELTPKGGRFSRELARYTGDSAKAKAVNALNKIALVQGQVYKMPEDTQEE